MDPQSFFTILFSSLFLPFSNEILPLAAPLPTCYIQKMANYIKVGVLAFLFVTTIGIFGHWLGGRQGALFAIIIAFSLIYIVYTVGNQMAFSVFTSRQIEGQDPWGLGEILSKVADRAKFVAPKIYIIDSVFPTIFSSGMKQSEHCIFITTGLVNTLTPNEVEAVIAQQIAFLKRREIIPAMIGAVLATAFLSFSENQSTTKKLPVITRLVFALFAPLALIAIHLHIGRKSYLNADSLACQWLDNPIHLAYALIKLDSYAKTQPPEVPFSLGHLFIVTPLTIGQWGRYFSVQPPIHKRIHKLVGYYPI
jgi:heat shock protein HtpX